MYSFLFDQTYINLLILVIIVSLVMFLWRKLIILEGNFFVLEKRVNLIKKDAREDSISRNIEKSDVIMNEIFKDYAPSNACKQSMYQGGSCPMPTAESLAQFVLPQHPDIDVITFANGGNIVLHPDDVYDSRATRANVEPAEPQCSRDTEDTAEPSGDTVDIDIDINKMVDTIISSSEEYEKKVREDAEGDVGDNDTISVSSEITFGDDKKTDDKALAKKYSKFSLDKLRELCNQSTLNNEGTKNELIKRIIEAKK
jgi:hypothetical protein